MTDKFSKEIRSMNMSRIRSTNTKPEEMVRKFLFSKGFRYRKNVKTLPGCPDIVLPKYKTVIFVNGCFWHRHEGCKYASVPKTRPEFWLNKFNKNIENDKRACQQLLTLGWNVITIWECELRPAIRDITMERLIYIIKGLVV